MPLIPPLPVTAKYSTKYVILSKVYTDVGDGIRELFHGLTACSEDNSLAKARGLTADKL